MCWRIYYGDSNGSTYSSQDGSPFDAPGHNVQVIRTEDDNRRHLVRGKDFYCWTPKGWVGMDWTGVVTSYYARPGTQKVLVGALMPDSDEYWQLCKRADLEPCNGDP